MLNRKPAHISIIRPYLFLRVKNIFLPSECPECALPAQKEKETDRQKQGWNDGISNIVSEEIHYKVSLISQILISAEQASVFYACSEGITI